MVGAVDIAYVAREVAATHPTLTAPARVIAIRAQGEAEIAREQGFTAYDRKTWASARQIAANQMIALPERARRGLVNLTNASLRPATGQSPQQRRSIPVNRHSRKDPDRRLLYGV